MVVKAFEGVVVHQNPDCAQEREAHGVGVYASGDLTNICTRAEKDGITSEHTPRIRSSEALQPSRCDRHYLTHRDSLFQNPD